MPANSLAILEGPNLTATATAVAIAAFLRVNLDAQGLISAAAIGVAGIGITKQAFAASGTGVVRLLNAPGTQIATASEAIAVGDLVYSAAAGQVSKTAAGAVLLGTATSAASGAGVLFTFIPTL